MEETRSVQESFLIPREALTYGRKLSESTESTVYQGTCNGHEVAIKVLAAPTKWEVAQREAEQRSWPAHPRVIRILGFCANDGAEIQEFLPGPTLATYLEADRETVPSWRTLRRLGRDVAEGLSHLHRFGLIHGNVSAGNVLIFWENCGSERRARLTPFSLARRDETVTPAMEVYEFGIILRQLVERVLPFDELRERAVDTQLPMLILNCLHSDPEARPPMDEVALRLKNECRRFPEIRFEVEVPVEEPPWPVTPVRPSRPEPVFREILSTSSSSQGRVFESGSNLEGLPSNVQEAISKLLFEQPVEMRVYGLDNQGIEALSSALTYNSSLRKLAIQGHSTKPIDCEGLIAFAWALSENRTLVELEISHAVMRLDGTSALAEVIATHPTLTRLSLTKSDMDDASGSALAIALEYNTALTDLDLSHNRILGRGFELFGRALSVNRSLKRLVLSHNWATPRGVAAIASALITNQVLEELDLQSSSVADKGAQSLAQALFHNSGLLSLKLAGNPITGRGAAFFSVTLRTNKTLKELTLFSEEGDQRIYDIGGLLSARGGITRYVSRAEEMPRDEAWGLPAKQADGPPEQKANQDRSCLIS